MFAIKQLIFEFITMYSNFGYFFGKSLQVKNKITAAQDLNISFAYQEIAGDEDLKSITFSAVYSGPLVIASSFFIVTCVIAPAQILSYDLHQDESEIFQGPELMILYTVIKMPVNQGLKGRTASVGAHSSEKIGSGEPAALSFAVSIIFAPAVDGSPYKILYTVQFFY